MKPDCLLCHKPPTNPINVWAGIRVWDEFWKRWTWTRVRREGVVCEDCYMAVMQVQMTSAQAANMKPATTFGVWRSEAWLGDAAGLATLLKLSFGEEGSLYWVARLLSSKGIEAPSRLRRDVRSPKQKTPDSQ